MKKIQLVLWLCFFAGVSWVGSNAYHYFFDKKNPELIVSGVVDSHYYAGDISCVINGAHSYKVGTISIFLDGTPLLYKFPINKRSFEHPFSINSRTLSNGKHQLKIALVDGSFQKNEAIDERPFFVDNTPLQAAFVKPASDIKVFQGKTVFLQFQTSKPLREAYVNAFGKSFICVPEKPGSLIYEAFIPVDCEEVPNEYLFSVHCIDNVENNVVLEGKLQVVPFPFKKGSLTVSDVHVTREKELGAAQAVLNDQLTQLALQSPKEKLWQGKFCVPTDVIRVSTEFGVIRTTPVRGRYAHKAIDIVNHPRSVVWAPQDGIIVIKDRFAFSGNTIIIDHGCGVLSLLFHLDSFADDVVVGGRIKKGNSVGKLGKTGYADGYHLHWEMRVGDVAIDPIEWTK